MTRQDLQELAEMRLADAEALLAAGRYSGAYYLAGYAVECGLKACIAKLVREYDFPDIQTVKESYTHDLMKLARIATIDLTAEFRADSDFATKLDNCERLVGESAVRKIKRATSSATDRRNHRPCFRNTHMVKTPLVEELRTAGREFIKLLDLSMDVRAALWLYSDEAEDWRLVIATPLADKIGSREVYRKIYPLWKSDEVLDWSQITVTGLNDPTVRLIGSVVRTGPALGGTTFSRNVINGSYIEDAYIYRMNL